MSRRVRWSEFEIQKILDKLQLGVPITRIAADFKVSRTAIYQLLKRRKLDINAFRGGALDNSVIN
jgi:uncharacterized protein (DUF433 family)